MVMYTHMTRIKFIVCIYVIYTYIYIHTPGFLHGYPKSSYIQGSRDFQCFKCPGKMWNDKKSPRGKAFKGTQGLIKPFQFQLL